MEQSTNTFNIFTCQLKNLSAIGIKCFTAEQTLLCLWIGDVCDDDDADKAW